MAKQRGRKSAGALEAVQSIPERPKPPADLGRRQKKIWIEVTRGLPVDWFTDETFGLLRDYCEQQATHDRLSDLINNSLLPGEEGYDDELEPMSVDELTKLIKNRDIVAGKVLSFATKMRITQQATYDKSKTKGAGPGKAPWRNVHDS